MTTDGRLRVVPLSSHGVPPPLPRGSRRVSSATRADRRNVVSSSDRAPGPVECRIDIEVPSIISAADALTKRLARSLRLPAESIVVELAAAAVVPIRIALRSRAADFSDTRSIMQVLAADSELRADIGRLLRIHTTTHRFAFVLRDPDVSDTAWSTFVKSGLLELADVGLTASLRACDGLTAPPDAEDTSLRVAFAEAVAPREWRALRDDLTRATSVIATLRTELKDERQRHEAQLSQEIDSRHAAEERCAALSLALASCEERAQGLEAQLRSSPSTEEFRRQRETLQLLELRVRELEREKRSSEAARLHADNERDRLKMLLTSAKEEQHTRNDGSAAFVRPTTTTTRHTVGGMTNITVAPLVSPQRDHRDRSGLTSTRGPREPHDRDSAAAVLQSRLDVAEAALRERTLQLAEALGVRDRRVHAHHSGGVC